MQDHRHDLLEAAFPGESARFYLSMFIGGTPEVADYAATAILAGAKTATSSPFWDYPDGRIPFVGALSVVLDGRRRPACVVETVRVQIVRFCDVTEAMAMAYGEGEETLAEWRRVTGDWYRAKAAREGQTFSEDDAIIWERIAVVRRPEPGRETL
jgi:uncharacterized protein YhfF